MNEEEKRVIDEMAVIIENGSGEIVTAVKIAKKLYNVGYRKENTCQNKALFSDGFVCSRCGYFTDEVNRTDIDKDDGEYYHYDYQFKYCPECGAKVVEQ